MRHKTTVHFGGNTTLHWTHTHTHMFLAHHVLFPEGRTTMDYLLFFNFINIIYVITIIPIS